MKPFLPLPGVGLCMLLLLPGTVLAGLTPEQVRSLPAAVSRPVDFLEDVKPILERSCGNCHGYGRDKGGFQIDTRETLLKGGDGGPAAISGKSGESLLIELVSGLNPDSVMPKKGSKLTPEQVGILRAWIDQGVPWDPVFTFALKPPVNLLPERSKIQPSSESPLNPIDQVLQPYFSRAGLGARTLVGDRVFARRVYLDTIGVLPEPEEIETFVADGSPSKREELVNALLARNSDYAENWLAFWNDLLRNDYRGTGYIDGGRKQVTEWLYNALVTNMPYNQFVAQLINPGPESEGFAKGIIWRGVVNSSQTPQMQAAQNISQVFMGVNLKCASCHDSFINHWRLSDSYGLAAIYADGPLEMFQCDKPTGREAAPRFIYAELGDIQAGAGKAERLRQLAEIVTGPRNGRLTRTILNRFWAKFFGRGLVEPVDDMEQPAWNPDLLNWLAEDMAANGYDLKRSITLILTAKVYQLRSVDLGEVPAKEYVFRGPGIRRISAEQFRDAVAQLTGDWCEKAEFSGRTNRIRASLVVSDSLTAALGRPNREQVCTTRAAAATTLQALELTNGETLAGILQRGAERLAAGTSDPNLLVTKVYQLALGRAPTQTEREIATRLIGQPVTRGGLEDLLWATTMLPEFQLIH